MWILFAFGSAIFAGITSILAKIGIKNTDSGLATAIRTIVVLVFSWIMVFIVGAQSELNELSVKTWIFLILSGLATGLSWLCYFKALQLGTVNKVAPIDKSSAVLTMLLAMIFLREPITVYKTVSIALLIVGTFLMLDKGKKKTTNIMEMDNKKKVHRASGKIVPLDNVDSEVCCGMVDMEAVDTVACKTHCDTGKIVPLDNVDSEVYSGTVDMEAVDTVACKTHCDTGKIVPLDNVDGASDIDETSQASKQASTNDFYKDKNKKIINKSWIIYAFASAIFASLTTILAKVGIENVNSNLGTAIRTLVVLALAWIIVLARGKQREIKTIDKKSWVFILLSGVTTGLSWLCYYKALKDGQASVVVPIDKLSLLITMAFSFFVLKEKFTKKALFGLVIIIVGTLLLLL